MLSNTFYEAFLLEICPKAVPLQCVFHSIRFKVNKGWSTAVLLFLCPYVNICQSFPKISPIQSKKNGKPMPPVLYFIGGPHGPLLPVFTACLSKRQSHLALRILTFTFHILLQEHILAVEHGIREFLNPVTENQHTG